ILALLRRAVVADRLAIVMVTHSQTAAGAADRVLIIRDGRLGAASAFHAAVGRSELGAEWGGARQCRRRWSCTCFVLRPGPTGVHTGCGRRSPSSGWLSGS